MIFIVKKIGLLLAIIFLLVPAAVFAQDTITLDTSDKQSFTDTVLDEKDEDDNPVIELDDNSVYVDGPKKRYKDKHSGPFIQAPKETEETEEKTQQRSGIIDYDPAHGAPSPKFFLFDVITKTAKDVYNLEIERTDVPAALLKDQLTFKMEKGPLESVHIWTAIQSNFSTTIPERGDTDSKFDVGLINILIDGQFKGGKENFRIMLDPTHRSSHLPFMEPFFQDLYIETHRLAHTSILVGNSRPGVGIEGAQSPYTLAFINRSQISRNLANIRKFGVRVRGDYSLMDYDMGFYSSSTNFTAFFPGHEFDAWMNIKPLGKTDGRYGKLVTGGGIQSGEKHGMHYYLTGAYAGYEYKRFWTKFEYARANGSNGGSGLTNKRSQGLFVTVAYHLTKKLEILARYDQFDPDRTVRNNNQREYTLGANYYLKGQALKLIFNYVYCQNDNKVDSHRLMIGSQILI